MRPTGLRLLVGMAVLVAIVVVRHDPPSRLSAQPTVGTSIAWNAYGNDAGGSKHSRADQITRSNVGTLTPAWIYRTGDSGVGRAQARDETTPIFVGSVLYASRHRSAAFAPWTVTRGVSSVPSIRSSI